MDYRSITFDWNRARAFLVTAEQGSFSAAAKALGTTQPTLGRQVDALEQELGIALFERVGRGLVLTPGGHELVDHVRAMAEAASRMSLAATGQSQTLEGTVSITASEIYSATILPPIIARLRRDYPKLKLTIVPANHAVDLQRREADIAIRNFRPTQNDLIARKLPDDRAYLYATPGYLDSIGNPTTIEALQQAEFIGFNHDTMQEMITGMAVYGLTLTADNFSINAGNHMVHWELTKLGCGIGVVPQTAGDAEPSVVRVHPETAPMVFPVWLVTHRELKTSRRVRAVYDVMAEMLGSS